LPEGKLMPTAPPRAPGAHGRLAVAIALAVVVSSGAAHALPLEITTAPSPHATTGARALGVSVSLTPAGQTVTPGSEFDVDVTVTQAGAPFNGFELVVGYDPGALTFLPASPLSLQQGCLMTGTCSSACGATFHLFSAAGDSLVVSDGLLCDQLSLLGPGQVYRFHFRAATTPQVTALWLRRVEFYDAGLLVTPVTAAGCIVGIGVALDAGAPASGPSLAIRAQPNPCRGRVQLTIADAGADEPDLRVVDVFGRTVRHLPPGRGGAGVRRVEWDGRTDSGERAPAGVYLVRLAAGARVRQTRVTLLW
jgi:hypothetical protein